jgi:hypothetical protein
MKYYNTELEVGKNDEGVLKDLLTDVVKSICQSLKKLRETKDSYSAQIKAIHSGIPNNHIREHCLANLAQIDMIGRDRCEQVRIERPTATGTARALYTVIDVHDENEL